MAARASGGVIAFAVMNIIVAIVPLCCGWFDAAQPFMDRPIFIQGRDVGPQLRQHLERKVPHAKAEGIIAAGGNSCFCLLLLVGAIGLFMMQQWARWLCVGTGIFLSLTMCLHDTYQITIHRPAVADFIDVQARVMPVDQRGPFTVGFTAGYFCWSCVNPVIMVYLFVMSLSLGMSSAFDASNDRPRRRRRRDRWGDDDDDDDDEPRPLRRKRGYDDDDDDDRHDSRARRRRRRDEDDD
jgi:hypothetical protein